MSTQLKETVFIKRKGIYHKIQIKDILVLEANGDYVVCHLKDDDKFVFRNTLKNALLLLPSTLFLRIHRSYAVQISKITGINFQEGLVHVGTQTVPANRESRKELHRMITLLE